MLIWRLLMHWGLLGSLRIAGRLLLDRRVPLGLRLLPVVALVYLLSPVDIIPDFLGLRGRLDDLLVLVLAPVLLLGLSPARVVAEHLRRLRKRGKAQDDKQVIEGSYYFIDKDNENHLDR